MNLTNYTTEQAFLPQLKCTDLAGALAAMVAPLAEADHLGDPAEVAAEVLRRERDGSTAVGGGVMVPHARIKGLDAVHLVIATLATPIDVPASDGRPIDVLILLIGPDSDPRRMLRVLARLAKVVRRPGILASLRDADTPGAMRQALSEADQAS